jgi:hypothetical protein
MADRETREFTTPGGHIAVLKTYVTGREANELKSVLYGALKMSMGDAQSGNVQVGEVSGGFLLDQERKAMSLVLVSFDGTAENALERLLDLPQAEYDAVKAEVDKITNPTNPAN